MRSFLDLPFEIRCEIYQYVLIDVNVSETKDGPCGDHTKGRVVVRPKFTTALFRVNKEVSSETLAYFHKQNKFVMFRTPWGSIYLEGLPMFPTLEPAGENPEELCMLPQALLDIKISPSHDPSFGVEREGETRPLISIFSLKHLPVFARLLYHPRKGWNPSNYPPHCIYLHFCLCLKTSNWSIGSKAIEALLIDAAVEFGKGRIQSIPIPDEELVSCFSGDFDPSLKLLMQQTMANQKPVTIPEDARFWIDQGNKARDSGADSEARSRYDTAQSVLYDGMEHRRNLSNGGPQTITVAEKEDVRRTQLLIYVEQAKRKSARGLHYDASNEIQEVLLFEFHPNSLSGPRLSGGELAGLLLLLALFQRRHGRIRAARSSLGEAWKPLAGASTIVHDDFEKGRADVEGPTDGKTAMSMVTDLIASGYPGSKYFDCSISSRVTVKRRQN